MLKQGEAKINLKFGTIPLRLFQGNYILVIGSLLDSENFEVETMIDKTKPKEDFED